MLITIYSNCHCGPIIGCIYATAYSGTFRQPDVTRITFDAYVIVSRLIIQNVVTVCKVLAKMYNCEGNCRLYLTIQEHFLTLISTFYFIILNFYSFMLFGYDAKPTAGTPVDRVYEIALDNVCN